MPIRSDRRRALGFVLLVGFTTMLASSAHAQPGAWRFYLDFNALSVDWVRTTQVGARDENTTIVSLGPNQLGASRLWIPTSPVGLGVGYVISPRWLIDLRAGLGVDLYSAKRDDDLSSFVAWSFMPGVSWLPRGLDGPLYLKFSPVLDFVQFKQGGERQRYFGGCFSAGVGSFWFINDHVSADLGLFFEGRFPDLDKKPDNVMVEFTNLRTVVRLGLSMWR